VILIPQNFLVLSLLKLFRYITFANTYKLEINFNQHFFKVTQNKHFSSVTLLVYHEYQKKHKLRSDLPYTVLIQYAHQIHTVWQAYIETKLTKGGGGLYDTLHPVCTI
jgi:long-subunit fatty acid transport protein